MFYTHIIGFIFCHIIYTHSNIRLEYFKYLHDTLNFIQIIFKVLCILFYITDIFIIYNRLYR